jgi:hypothetical protein
MVEFVAQLAGLPGEESTARDGRVNYSAPTWLQGPGIRVQEAGKEPGF